MICSCALEFRALAAATGVAFELTAMRIRLGDSRAHPAIPRWGRVLGYVLLAVSVFSATFRDWNPWRHPWLWQVMQAREWLPY